MFPFRLQWEFYLEERTYEETLLDELLVEPLFREVSEFLSSDSGLYSTFIPAEFLNARESPLFAKYAESL